MTVYNRPVFPRIKSVIPEFPVSTAASTGNAKVYNSSDLGGPGYIKLQCTTGVIYICTTSTAPTAVTGWRLEDGHDPFDMRFTDYVALYSTSTGMLAQIAIIEP